MDDERKQTYSLNVRIAQLRDPEFDYTTEMIANTERYRRLVVDYERDLNAVADALPDGWYDFSIIKSLDGTFTATIIEDDPPIRYKHRWAAKALTRQEAFAGALLVMLTAQATAASAEPSP